MSFEKGQPDFLSDRKDVIQVVILYKPEEKFRVNSLQRALEMAGRALKVNLEITRTNDFPVYSGYNFNPTNTPVVFINGNLEFVSAVPQVNLLKKKLKEIKERGSFLL